MVVSRCLICRGWMCEVCCGLFLDLANKIDSSLQRAVYLGKRFSGEADGSEHLDGVGELPDSTGEGNKHGFRASVAVPVGWLLRPVVCGEGVGERREGCKRHRSVRCLAFRGWRLRADVPRRWDSVRWLQLLGGGVPGRKGREHDWWDLCWLDAVAQRRCCGLGDWMLQFFS